LRLEQVVAGYRPGEPVVQGMDLELNGGDFLGLIGPNGCGKSTLIRAITGIVPLSRGGMWLENRDLRSLSRRERARLFGVVPQEISCPFAFTVGELVAMGRNPHLGRFRRPGKEDERIVHEALAQTDLEHLAGRSILELSGGERQRAIIARALAQKPRILLLDEPSNHLDISHQVEVFDLLHQLNQEQGLALLCVTHDLNFAAEYCDRILLMDQGRTCAYGRPEEVITSQLVGAVYGVEVTVEKGPGGNGLRVQPVSRKARRARGDREEVQV
jgi:iron complex transport system ATP-binding protein